MQETTELPSFRFIPFRRADIIQMLLSENTLPTELQQQFLNATKKIDNYFQRDFYELKQQLKNAYSRIDPDTDTRILENIGQEDSPAELSRTLEEVLERANYEKVSSEALEKALRSSSLFQLRLFVDLNDFEEVILYTRGASKREETLREFFGLWKRRVKFTNFDRVVLYIRLKDDIDGDSTLVHSPPGSTMLKLFQNVPAADLEMLFPNIRIGMRLVDKLIVGVPAVVSGAVVISTKMGATLLLLGSLLGFWLGTSSEPVELDKAALVAVLASLGALGGYVWKQFSNFRNRKIKYTQALTQNLYFKLLDNNAGVFHRVLDDAEEAESKESLLAYHFLLAYKGKMSATELDQSIEQWFQDRWQCKVNFEIEDALQKLDKLGLVSKEGKLYSA